jgi:hypothetical protein
MGVEVCCVRRSWTGAAARGPDISSNTYWASVSRSLGRWWCRCHGRSGVVPLRNFIEQVVRYRRSCLERRGAAALGAGEGAYCCCDLGRRSARDEADDGRRDVQERELGRSSTTAATSQRTEAARGGASGRRRREVERRRLAACGGLCCFAREGAGERRRGAGCCYLLTDEQKGREVAPWSGQEGGAGAAGVGSRWRRCHGR